MFNDSPFIKRIVATLLLLATTLLSVFYVLRSEITESLSDSITTNSLAVKRVISNKELESTSGYELRPERNDARLIQINHLVAMPKTSIGTPIQFILNNEGDSNDFPSLKIYFLNASGVIVREKLFAPSDYEHKDRFETNEVQLLVSVGAGESGFTVKPYYEERP